MATSAEVEAAGLALRNALFARKEDPDLTADLREDFRRTHTGMTQALQRFSLAPAAGDQSPSYDGFVASANACVASLANLDTASTAAVQAVLAEARDARKHLESITSPVPAGQAGRGGLVGSLAIRRGPAPHDTGLGGDDNDVAEQTEPYLTSLAKLFPAEALSALLLVLAIAPQFEVVRHVMIGLIALALVVLRYFATRGVDGRPDILAIFVSLISFLIYAAAMLAFGVLFKTNAETTRIIATVAAILWMAILTNVVRSKATS